MKEIFSIPNLISYFRVLLLPYAFYLFLENHHAWLFAILTLFIISLDGIDGIVARKFNLATALGAKIDIYGDRIVELGYWWFFGYLGLIPFWVFWFFLLRGLVVDYLSREQEKPLGMSFLRSSRFMRAGYGVLKLLSFVLLILIPHYEIFGFNLSHIVSYITVVICALRALPVILD